MSDRLARWILVVLLLAGFGLRVHGLGDAGLRLDEAGQAWAATQPTLAGLVAIERTHVMAMPLDYVLTRAMATVNDNEFVLRLPSAAWATLNIAALYALTRLLTGRRTAALLAALLLTVSPLHVGYAQVLRFYASLSTFYALACLLLYRALRRPTGGRWAAFGLVTLIGAYSHPFVPTVAVNGAAYFLLAGPARRENRPALLRFIGVMLVVGVLFLPGYLTFGVQHQYDFEPFQFSGSLRTVILSGLDWTTTLGVASAGPAAAVWRWVNAARVALGWAALLRHATRAFPRIGR
ncbi:MAG: glycosyltransferase family 39 protein [Candidatus Promineofilum sp.]|nr:glycosyltransferase family 39 protein [Promineifilum sp.]